jgi:large subunit ribosomal protein L5
MNKNIMQQIGIEKLVVNCGGLDDKLKRSIKLLNLITGRKVAVKSAQKRIPDFGISPGKNCGAVVTIRKIDDINKLLVRFFASVDNKLKPSQIMDNHLSFGIKEYIEVPGLEYSRDIGMLGFQIDLSFTKKGKRVKLKKIKKGKYPKKQKVAREEIIDYIKQKYNVEIE